MRLVAAIHPPERTMRNRANTILTLCLLAAGSVGCMTAVAAFQPTMGDVIVLMPPLCITLEEIDRLMDVMGACIREVCAC